jgi:hypothetical protein
MRFATCIVLALLTSTSLAQTVKKPDSHYPRMVWEPPDWDYPESAKATVRKELLTSFRVSGYKIVLEETAMKDAQDRLGGEVGSRKDGRDASEWLCYHGTNERGKWVLWLENDEMSPGLIGSFQWRQLSKNDVLDPRCHALASGNLIRLSLPYLNLEATQSQVLQSLGSPTVKDTGRFIYLHAHDVTGKIVRDDPFISSNVVIVRFRNGAVWAIQASKTTSD